MDEQLEIYKKALRTLGDAVEDAIHRLEDLTTEVDDELIPQIEEMINILRLKNEE